MAAPAGVASAEGRMCYVTPLALPLHRGARRTSLRRPACGGIESCPVVRAGMYPAVIRWIHGRGKLSGNPLLLASAAYF